jgi:hypothetical protein
LRNSRAVWIAIKPVIPVMRTQDPTGIVDSGDDIVENDSGLRFLKKKNWSNDQVRQRQTYNVGGSGIRNRSEDSQASRREGGGFMMQINPQAYLVLMRIFIALGSR